MAAYRYFGQPPALGIEATGKTPEDAFENVACALFGLMTHPSLILPERSLCIEFNEADPARALATWLERLGGQAAFAGLVLSAFELTRDGTHYLGRAWGMPWKAGAERGLDIRHAGLREPSVTQAGKRWQVRCTVLCASAD